VAVPVASAARAVIQLVLDQIEGQPPPRRGTLLPTRLIPGGSA
jgi:DNA-binding LacI/PurR family transcriptional regulator